MSLGYEVCETCKGFFKKKESKQVKCPRCQRKAVRERQKEYNKKKNKAKADT